MMPGRRLASFVRVRSAVAPGGTPVAFGSFRPLPSLSSSSLRSNSLSTDAYPLPVPGGGHVRQRQTAAPQSVSDVPPKWEILHTPARIPVRRLKYRNTEINRGDRVECLSAQGGFHLQRYL